jgi:NAD(P)-dependent dehydrogenase (short-subunit alcohol dehydrogenase family)
VRDRFAGKVALVTGGGSGIGKSACLAFAEEGAKVAVADLNEDTGKEVAEAIRKKGGEAVFTHTDVTDPDQVQALYRRVREAFGGLDFVFCNAGAGGLYVGGIEDCPEDAWDKLIALNLTSVYLSTKYAIPLLKERGQGSIVITSSVNGLESCPAVAGYAAAKHGAMGFMKSVAVDLARFNIRVNALCPGATATPFHGGREETPEFRGAFGKLIPLGQRMAEPAEMAAVALWLCSDDASYVTGTQIIADGGLMAKSFNALMA